MNGASSAPSVKASSARRTDHSGFRQPSVGGAGRSRAALTRDAPVASGRHRLDQPRPGAEPSSTSQNSLGRRGPHPRVRALPDAADSRRTRHRLARESRTGGPVRCYDPTEPDGRAGGRAPACGVTEPPRSTSVSDSAVPDSTTARMRRRGGICPTHATSRHSAGDARNPLQIMALEMVASDGPIRAANQNSAAGRRARIGTRRPIRAVSSRYARRFAHRDRTRSEPSSKQPGASTIRLDPLDQHGSGVASSGAASSRPRTGRRKQSRSRQ